MAFQVLANSSAQVQLMIVHIVRIQDRFGGHHSGLKAGEWTLHC